MDLFGSKGEVECSEVSESVGKMRASEFNNPLRFQKHRFNCSTREVHPRYKH